MKATLRMILVLGLTAGGCATPPLAPPRQSPAEAQVVALQQERQQLLTTLGEFHDRIRDLESKLADREGRPVAQSYDQLLAIKEAELSELRKTSAESGKLSAQLNTAATDLNQARLRVSALEQQVTKKDQELASMKGLATAAAELESAKHRIVDLETLLSQRDQENRSLRTSTAERESLVAQLQTATGTLNHTKERLASIERQLVQKDSDLRNSGAEKQKLAAHLTAYSNELRQTRQRMASFEQHATEREQELNVTRKGVSDRDRLVNQLTVANMDLTQTKQRASNLERQLAARAHELEMMQNVMTSKEKSSDAPAPRNTGIGRPSGSNVGTEVRQDSGTSPSKSGTQNSRIGTSPSHSSSDQPIAKHIDQPDSELINASEHLVRLLKDEVSRGTISVKQHSNQLAVGLSSSLLFQSGEATLKPDGMNVLKRIGNILGQVPNNVIQVAGHTDNQAIRKGLRKTFPDNKALSWARAENARRGLINGGLPMERIKAIGLADKVPLVSNTTEAGRQRNRRIEIVVTHLAASPAAMKVTSETYRGPSMASLPPSEKRGSP
ncbi:MAG: OmpA family protein [Nitrospiraceae bacterium]